MGSLALSGGGTMHAARAVSPPRSRQGKGWVAGGDDKPPQLVWRPTELCSSACRWLIMGVSCGRAGAAVGSTAAAPWGCQHCQHPWRPGRRREDPLEPGELLVRLGELLLGVPNCLVPI